MRAAREIKPSKRAEITEPFPSRLVTSESPQEDGPEGQLTNKARLLEERGRALQAEGAAGASARDGRDLGRLREDPWAGTELAGRDSGGGTRSL